MLKKLFSKANVKTVSLYLSNNKIAICENDQGQRKLRAAELINSEAEWPSVLQKIVTTHHLQGTKVAVVIGRDFYQSFDIDKPQLEEKELAASLPFTIKDMVAESVFDLVVDYFDKPTQVRKAAQITVVCIPKARVIAIRDMLAKCELTLTRITIEEMAICQLFDNSEEANLLISQQANELVLSVVKNSQLHFSLRVRGYNDLLPLPLADVESSLVDGLSLEIQRVLDYISSQLRINAVGSLYLALQCNDIESLSDKLSEYIGRKVQPLSEQFDYKFLFAYGGFDQGAIS